MRIDLDQGIACIIRKRKGVVLLLCGGSKRNQAADIKDAVGIGVIISGEDNDRENKSRVSPATKTHGESFRKDPLLQLEYLNSI